LEKIGIDEYPKGNPGDKKVSYEAYISDPGVENIKIEMLNPYGPHSDKIGIVGLSVHNIEIEYLKEIADYSSPVGGGSLLRPINMFFESESVEQGEHIEHTAENLITIENATFEEHSEGDFTSGNAIKVVPETRFEPGSEVHLKVDASLKE
jgi:hypothetical protein